MTLPVRVRHKRLPQGPIRYPMSPYSPKGLLGVRFVPRHEISAVYFVKSHPYVSPRFVTPELPATVRPSALRTEHPRVDKANPPRAHCSPGVAARTAALLTSYHARQLVPARRRRFQSGPRRSRRGAGIPRLQHPTAKPRRRGAPGGCDARASRREQTSENGGAARSPTARDCTGWRSSVDR